MKWAVFSAEGQPLATFADDLGRYDPAEMADAALASYYADRPGAFVAELCHRHEQPLGDCTVCRERFECPRCAELREPCPKHR